MPRTSGSSDETMMMHLPWRMSSFITLYTSTLAPTSMPRVGLVEDVDLGVAVDPLADDDLLLVAAGELHGDLVDRGRLDAQRPDQIAADPGRSGGPSASGPRWNRFMLARIMLVLTDWLSTSPWPLPILGQERDAVADRRAGALRRTTFLPLM